MKLISQLRWVKSQCGQEFVNRKRSLGVGNPLQEVCHLLSYPAVFHTHNFVHDSIIANSVRDGHVTFIVQQVLTQLAESLGARESFAESHRHRKSIGDCRSRAEPKETFLSNLVPVLVRGWMDGRGFPLTLRLSE